MESAGDVPMANNQHMDSNANVPKLMKNEYASEVSRRQYMNARTADVFFTFDNSDERIPAHKSVLSAASKVFDAMFYGPMAVNGDVRLPGKSPEAFKHFLKFCYLDEVALKVTNITDVMGMLSEYQMSEGLMVCGRFLADNWTIANIDEISSMYDWAINLHMDEFQAFCERKIGVHAEKIFKTNDFLTSSFAVLDRILALDSLLCDESVVLGACLDWARHKCQQDGKDVNDMKIVREYLIDRSTGTNLLWKIRYGSIGQGKFLTFLNSNSGIFADFAECEDMMRLLLGSKDLKTGKFQIEPRKLDWSDDHALDCELLTNPIGPRTLSKCIVNVIRVNKLILLHGFYNIIMASN